MAAVSPLSIESAASSCAEPGQRVSEIRLCRPPLCVQAAVSILTLLTSLNTSNTASSLHTVHYRAALPNLQDQKLEIYFLFAVHLTYDV